MNGILTKYLNHPEPRFAPTTIANIRSSIRRFLNWCETKKLPLHQIQSHDLQSYAFDLGQRPIVAKTCADHLRNLKSFFA